MNTEIPNYHCKPDGQTADTKPSEVALHPPCSAAGPVYSRKPETAALELIDGAYDIIELWEPKSPSQEAWRNAWLAKAKELGAHPSW